MLFKTLFPKHLTVTLLATAVAVSLAGCNDDDDEKSEEQSAAAKTISFTAVKAPETDAEKRQILASPSVNVGGTDYPIGYNTIMRSGEKVGDWQFGQLVDSNMTPLMSEDGAMRISNSNDFASLLPVGEKLFMVSHFESRPGAMYLTELEQANDGHLSPISTKPIDFSGIRGGWVHCAGSVTPWNSHLGSEEYEPNAKTRDNETGDNGSYYNAMAAYYGNNLLELNPYDYGFPIEVQVTNEAGDHKVHKHYAMGRIAYELSYVMPDKKTVYSSDDGTNVGLFMFIADKAGDLSAGTLYAMKWNQTSADNGGSANLEWINLGHANSSEIKTYIEGIQKVGQDMFHDIFDEVEPSEDNACPASFTSINTTRGHECLRIRAGMEKVASRLETRRYAAMLGATTELRKEEGITYNPDKNVLYVAISAIQYGMEDNMKKGKANNKYDIGGPNHIKVPHNNCGGVYELTLTADDNIGSDYVAQTMHGLVLGMPKSYPENSAFANNSCDLDGLANPDNITYMPGYSTLIIGEDTGSGHQNDMIWSYNLEDASLTRIQTTPYGSETTSPYFYPDINGFGYLMSVVQHPYGESDREKSTGASDNAAYTGYIGPFPSMK